MKTTDNSGEKIVASTTKARDRVAGNFLKIYWQEKEIQEKKDTCREQIITMIQKANADTYLYQNGKSGARITVSETKKYPKMNTAYLNMIEGIKKKWEQKCQDEGIEKEVSLRVNLSPLTPQAV